jgi:hypothetical protein
MAAATLIVRRSMAAKKSEREVSFTIELKSGWRAVSKNRGVYALASWPRC